MALYQACMMYILALITILNLAREQLNYFCKIIKSEVIFLSSTSDLDFFLSFVVFKASELW